MKKFQIGIEDLTWKFFTKTIIFWHFVAIIQLPFLVFSLMSKTLQLIFNIFTQTNLLSI